MRFQKRVTLPLVGWIKEILYKKESKVCLKKTHTHTHKNKTNKQTNKQWKGDYDNDPDREKRLSKDQIGKLGLKGKYSEDCRKSMNVIER